MDTITGESSAIESAEVFDCFRSMLKSVCWLLKSEMSTTCPRPDTNVPPPRRHAESLQGSTLNKLLDAIISGTLTPRTCLRPLPPPPASLAPQLFIAARADLDSSPAPGFSAEIESTMRDNDPQDHTAYRSHKQALEQYGFLLQWFVSQAEKVAAGQAAEGAITAAGKRVS